jgi:hypothetical protein
MAKIIVVTSGKGGVGKTTTSASFAVRPGIAWPQDRRDRLRRGPAQPGPDHGLRAPRGVRPDQRDPRRGQAQPGADQGQAVRQPVRAGCLADPRQGSPHARTACEKVLAELSDDGLRVHRLRLAGRHRNRRADGHALCRRGPGGDQPRGLQVRDSDRILGMLAQQDAARHRRQGPDQRAPADHALQPQCGWTRARCCRSTTSTTSCAFR